MEDMEVREAVGGFAKFWWIELLLGIVWIIVSLVVLQFEEASITTIGVILGIIFLAAGIQQFFLAYIAEGWKWLWVVFGVLFLICGIVALVYPKETFASLADMLGFLFLVFGTFWLIEAFMVRDANDLWWLGLIAGILMIVLAFWSAGQFFITKAYTLLVFAGIFALFHGIDDIIKAFMIRKAGRLMTA